jgi:tRNA A37 threonylcarbamoyltransferase TsaD
MSNIAFAPGPGLWRSLHMGVEITRLLRLVNALPVPEHLLAECPARTVWRKA